MIDLETPSPTDERQKGPKRVLVAALLAAAAVVAIAVVATRDDDAGRRRPTVTDRDRAPDESSASVDRAEWCHRSARRSSASRSCAHGHRS